MTPIAAADGRNSWDHALNEIQESRQGSIAAPGDRPRPCVHGVAPGDGSPTCRATRYPLESCRRGDGWRYTADLGEQQLCNGGGDSRTWRRVARGRM